MVTVGCFAKFSSATAKAIYSTRRETSFRLTIRRSSAKTVHLNDIHLERGMHCVDCHFRQDAHGDGVLYNEPRAAIEITCEDCHGSITQRATLFTSGFAAAPATGAVAQRRKTQNQPAIGQDLSRIFVRDPSGTRIPLMQRIPRDRKRKDDKGTDIDLKAGDIVQNSMVVPGRWWRVPQTLDTVTPGSRDFNERSQYAKTIQKDNATWGAVPSEANKLAHRDTDMTCVACHSSWVTSCFGCHLSMQANRKMPNRHNEGRQFSKLHAVQLSGSTRRHLYARAGWNCYRKPRRASSFFVSYPGQFTKPKS
jgi:hypothetical protein